jgi:hypothetical protein
VHLTADGAFSPKRTRTAPTALTAPVVVYAGELDLAPDTAAGR